MADPRQVVVAPVAGFSRVALPKGEEVVLWHTGMRTSDRGLAASALRLALVVIAVLAVGAQVEAQDEWIRDVEPVEVTGEQLREHRGEPLDELGVYVYVDGEWSPIPFQIDEVNGYGEYLAEEDGELDDNDVLVFMARDLGEDAGDEWLDDPYARYNARTEIHVVDPEGSGAEGWAYVYEPRIPDLAADDYVNWNADLERVEAISYTIGFSPSVHAGIEYLALNGHKTDVLDRTKIRASVRCTVLFLPIRQTLTEEDLAGALDPTPRIDGPVRVGSGSDTGAWWYYGRLYQTDLVLDTAALKPAECTRLDIDSVRLSTDWRDPVTTGMSPTIYYDANVPDGVRVDGVRDDVPDEPVSWWKQVSGNLGSLVVVASAELEDGEPLSYYVDDADIARDDTGDRERFGDAGFQVLDPSGRATIRTRAIVLGPNHANVGEAYAESVAAPLEVTVTAQRSRLGTYTPVVMRLVR